MFMWYLLGSKWVIGLVMYLFLVSGLFVLCHQLKLFDDLGVVSVEGAWRR